MDRTRAYLRDLAMELGDAWAASPMPASLRGDVRVETRNTIYGFRDGICREVVRRDHGLRSDPVQIVGMRLLGWLLPDDPYAGLQVAWRPGAYAVLWRTRRDASESTVALTSTTTAFAPLRRASPPAAPRAVHAAPTRKATPPPLPAAALRPTRGSPATTARPRPPPVTAPSGVRRANLFPRCPSDSTGSYART